MGGIIFAGNALMLSVSSYFDIKYKRIPNLCVLIMLTILSVYHAINVILGGMPPTLMQTAGSLEGALTPFFVMLPSEVMIKRKFGAGDKKALMVLGLTSGFWGMIFIIFFMLAGALCYSLIRRKGRGVYIAMAPFILASYIISIITLC